ncbi:transposase, partial [candidate division KSB1 bacterium]|nr:transposase [candidate division KSB1 bacterium]
MLSLVFKFQQIFKSEDDCRNFLYSRRWPNGFKC